MLMGDWSRDRNGAATRGLVPRYWCPHHGTVKGKNMTWFHCTSCGMRQVSESTSHGMSGIYYKAALRIWCQRFPLEFWKSSWFCITTLFFHPIKSKTKTNRDSVAHVFPCIASAACIFSCFDWFPGLSVSCDWLEWLLWVRFATLN